MPHPSPQEKTTPTSSSSPFIESKASAYSGHVAAVMGGRSQMEFLELLPPGATKKTASVAFSHVLSKHLDAQVLSVILSKLLYMCYMLYYVHVLSVMLSILLYMCYCTCAWYHMLHPVHVFSIMLLRLPLKCEMRSTLQQNL